MKRDYKIDVYGAMLRIANDKKSAHSEDDENDSPSCAIYGSGYTWWVVIYLPDKCLRKACHESVHGALSLLDVIGHKNHNQDQEPVAYLTDFIFSKCQDFIDKLPA
jgi:hypothetical protein